MTFRTPQFAPFARFALIALSPWLLPGCSAIAEMQEIFAVAGERMEQGRESGNAHAPRVVGEPIMEVDLISMSHSIADALVGELRKNQPSFHRRSPIMVATFVSLGNLESSSELGMVLADQVASRFTQQGYAVVEARLRKQMAIHEGKGEFILSRDIDNIAAEYKASAVLVGNYSRTKDVLYLTAKLVQLKDHQVMASVNAKMPLTGSADELLIQTDCCAVAVVDK
ncbi:MAG: hypothetical protein HQL51_12990 [Magnetococcales bacterium]|nr:hypothetical protein [Magnetococcales bacterium]